MRLVSPTLTLAAAAAPPPDAEARARQDVAAGRAVAGEVDGDQVRTFARDASGGLAESFVSAGPRADQKDGFFRNFFLPNGFPNSVHADYLPNRKWSFASEVAASITSYFGTAAVTGALGFGAVGPITVGMAWMIRDSVDGLGKFAGSFLASKADQDPRGWLVRGEAVNAAGKVAETALVLAPQTFLFTAPAANILKAFGSTLKGAANATVEKHHAVDNNIGEVHSKNANQNMAASMIGAAMGFGLETAARATVGAGAIPLIAVGATALSVLAQKRASEALQLNDLNSHTVKRLVERWLKDGGALPGPEKPDLLGEIARDVRGIFRNDAGLEVGASIEDLMGDAARFDRLRSLYAGRPYMLDADGDRTRVVLRHGADESAGKLLGTVQAALVERLQRSAEFERIEKKDGRRAACDWVVETSLRATPADAGTFLKDLAAQGWSTERVMIPAGASRGVWQDGPPAALPPLALEDLRKLTAS